MKPVPPVTIAEVSPEWIAERREVIDRDGYALRAGAGARTIEIKSLRTNEWCVMALPGGARQFTDAGDRDLVLQQLQSKA